MGIGDSCQIGVIFCTGGNKIPNKHSLLLAGKN
jgi:hypothetical protein